MGQLCRYCSRIGSSLATHIHHKSRCMQIICQFPTSVHGDDGCPAEADCKHLTHSATQWPNSGRMQSIMDQSWARSARNACNPRNRWQTVSTISIHVSVATIPGRSGLDLGQFRPNLVRLQPFSCGGGHTSTNFDPSRQHMVDRISAPGATSRQLANTNLDLAEVARD